MHYQQIIFIIEASQAEDCAEFLEKHDALSITFSESENEPLFQIEVNETPLWKRTKVTSCYPEDADLKPLIEELKKHFPKIEALSIELIADQDWVRLTQQNFPTQAYNENLWIVPSWEKPEKHYHNIVRIDPGLAFGTGTHTTTALCLEYLAQNPPKDMVVVDYGCGSGILALAALALGAKKVYAIDHDIQALEATYNNAQLNDFANDENLIICDSNSVPEITSPFIIANILAKPLMKLAPKIIDLLESKGTLILSGLLTGEQDEVLAAYENACTLTNAVSRDEWARLELEAD